jgi:parallel beta-helix repeat protein
MQVRNITLVTVVILSGLILGAAPASAGGTREIVVDDDRAQCPRAGYVELQPAISAARPGDTVRVCGGSYGGAVMVPQGVALVAQTPAARSIDCLGGGAAAPETATITGAVTLSGTGAQLDGLIVTGADTGVTTSVEASGYTIRRNLIQGNGNFGIDLRSSGGRPTVVEQNCVRGNGVNGIQGVQAGLVSDFADLHNAAIRSNSFVGNSEAVSVSGLKSYSNISISRNVVRREAIVAAGLVASEIVRNDIDNAGAAAPVLGIVLGGGNIGLTIASNTITSASAGLFFCSNCTNDFHNEPNTGLWIRGNMIRNDVGSGISMATVDPAAPIVVTRSVIERNTIIDNGTSGIVLNQGSVNNVLLRNTSARNLRGILLNGATGTTVLRNTLTDNREIDARDILPNQNTWFGNHCATDDPEGSLCTM